MKLARYKRSNEFSYTLGATLSYEALKNNHQNINRLFLRPDIKKGEDIQKILGLAQSLKIEVIESTKAFNILGAKDNCLIIAEFKKQSSELNPDKNHIVLVNPSDAGNLGTIMRSAAGFNFEDIAIIGDAVDYYDPKTIRASMGAIFHLRIQTFPDINAYLAKNDNRELYAFMLDQRSQDLEKITPTSTYSLVFGNEASGLPKEFADICTPVIIDQSNNIDSLNLSIAASIAMYEFHKK